MRLAMIIVFLKSLIFAVLIAALMIFINTTLHTENYISDIGGIQTYLGFFGTLYGIMAAFVVFEVWNQYNKTSALIDKEALGLEKLYRLTLYFRDKKLTDKMKTAITDYTNLIIAGKFSKLGQGLRNPETSKMFRKMVIIIRDIDFDDNHDQIVFDHIIKEYGQLSEIRTERINQSLSRLPSMLKFFLNITSGLALIAFILLPFNTLAYGILATGSLAFIVATIYQLVDDLDNPFIGYWKITPESFDRTLKHINEDY